MHKSDHLKIHEITRIEGHGNITIDIKKGHIEELKLEIIESPRFFEAMLIGRRYDEAHHITSRICGICATSHTAASLKAIEDAMGMKISTKSRLLRELAFAGETLQSHILHLYFLVIPDFFNAGSIIELMKKAPDIVKTGLELKNIANRISTIVGGRAVHPISLFPGGVVYTPKEKELKELKNSLIGSIPLLLETLELFISMPTVGFQRKKEFISLKKKKGYSFYDGEPFSNKKTSIKTKTYAKNIKEYVVSHSTAKHTKTRHGTFAVGALARLNNNHANLNEPAKTALKRMGLKLPSFNPFDNNSAQVIECFHVTMDAIGVIDKLLTRGLKQEKIKKPVKYGRGIGLVEAPRGTLYHDYTINKNGIIKKANCIIPTQQNLRAIEEDLRAFVPSILDKPKKDIIRGVEMLVRSYDPCISCSTHIMDVKFL